MLKAGLLAPGTAAPSFRLLDQAGHCLGPADFQEGKGVVLLFFASDWLKADLDLLEAYARAYLQFEAAGIAVLGVSGINWEKIHHLSKRLALPFPVLFDPCCRYSKKYGAMLVPKFVTGRAVYGIDPAGMTVLRAKKHSPPEETLGWFLPGRSAPSLCALPGVEAEGAKS